MARASLGRVKKLVSLDPEDVEAVEALRIALDLPDDGAAVREILKAWASDDRTKRSVSTWRSRLAGEKQGDGSARCLVCLEPLDPDAEGLAP